MFIQGLDEAFCEPWERFKVMLRKCSKHGFEDIAQMNIFHNGLRLDTKVLLYDVVDGTMMVVDVEQSTKIIDAMASKNYQAHHDRQDRAKERDVGP